MIRGTFSTVETAIERMDSTSPPPKSESTLYKPTVLFSATAKSGMWDLPSRIAFTVPGGRLNWRWRFCIRTFFGSWFLHQIDISTILSNSLNRRMTSTKWENEIPYSDFDFHVERARNVLDIVTSQEEVFVVETTVEPRYRRQRCNVDKDIFGGNKARPPRQVDSERKGAFKSFKIEFSLLPFQKKYEEILQFCAKLSNHGPERRQSRRMEVQSAGDSDILESRRFQKSHFFLKSVTKIDLKKTHTCKVSMTWGDKEEILVVCEPSQPRFVVTTAVFGRKKDEAAIFAREHSWRTPKRKYFTRISYPTWIFRTSDSAVSRSPTLCSKAERFHI